MSSLAESGLVRAEPAGKVARPYHEVFNESGFSRFINSRNGRVFRVAAGAGFLALGYLYRRHPLGIAAMAWSALPLSAGALDLCYVSAALGGPVSGATIRANQHRSRSPEERGVHGPR